MFLDNPIILAPLNGVAGARISRFLGSESVQVHGLFYGLVPYHPTDGMFGAFHACFLCVAGGAEWVEQSNLGEGDVGWVQSVGCKLLWEEEAASDVQFLSHVYPI